MSCIFKPCHRIIWHVPSKMPDLTVIPNMVPYWSLLMICNHFPHCHRCNMWRDNMNAQIFNQSFPTFYFEKTIQKSVFPQGVVTKSSFEYFMHCQCSYMQFMAKLCVNTLFLETENHRARSTCATKNTH